MKKFEYKSIQQRLTETELNHLGREGWELVSHTAVAVNGEFGQYYVFKREFMRMINKDNGDN